MSVVRQPVFHRKYAAAGLFFVFLRGSLGLKPPSPVGEKLFSGRGSSLQGALLKYLED